MLHDQKKSPVSLETGDFYFYAAGKFMRRLIYVDVS